MGQYDDICGDCGGVEQDDEPCVTCDSWGYLLTAKGFDLIEFLKRRGVSMSMSPRAEADLANTLEK